MKRLLLACLLAGAAWAQGPAANIQINTTNVQGGTPSDCLIVGTNRKLSQQNCTAGGAAPTGPAGGDLSGTYPNPTVHQVNGTAVPLSAGAVGTDANGGLISVSPGGVTPPGYPGNAVSAGCGVEYVSGLTFVVGECVYTIGGTQYTISTPTTITLTAADATNPRIDVIYVDDSSVANKLTGTPASNPSQPTVDYSTELPLNFVLVPANSSTPGGIALTSIYDENTEWTSTCSAHLNCASTNNPFRGTKTIEATAAVLGNSVTLVKPAAGTVDLSTQNTLIFYIRSKAAWPTGNGSGSNGLRTLSLFWLSGSTQVGLQVVLKDGAFGFSSSNTTTYQQIAIPISLFGTGSTTVTTLKAQVSGNGGTSSFGWYLDAITLQSGQAPITLPTTLMKFQGTWNTTSNYNPNDVVVSGGIGYVAKAANTNVAVTTTATWAPVAGCGTTCVVATSPGAGIAHFAGSTQTVTSSLIVAADITSATITGTQLAASLALTTPNIGAATGTSLLASGIVDGKAPVDITTSTPVSLGGTYKSGYTFNEHATAGTAITYNLPTAAAGLQYCVGNAYNGSAANTGVITLATSASGQFIIYTDGTLTATGGNVTSAGAGGDFACVVGLDSTHWILKVGGGTWTKN